MIKYFTKYLPVEGEINEGDHVIDPRIAPKDGLDYIKEDNFINAMGEDVILPDWKTRFNFQKQKLFVCSKDIQVGDKLTCADGNTSIIETESQLKFLAPDIWFKVVGEISSEATWVLEEDQFNDDEIKQKEEFYTWENDYIDEDKKNDAIIKNFTEFSKKSLNSAKFIVDRIDKFEGFPEEYTVKHIQLFDSICNLNNFIVKPVSGARGLGIKKLQN